MKKWFVEVDVLFLQIGMLLGKFLFNDRSWIVTFIPLYIYIITRIIIKSYKMCRNIELKRLKNKRECFYEELENLIKENENER